MNKLVNISIDVIKKCSFMITLFCVLLISVFSFAGDTFALDFSDKDLNDRWNAFYEENKGVYNETCYDKDYKEVRCTDAGNVYRMEDLKLKGQERFYKKLFSVSDEYNEKGYDIDELVIVATIFYKLNIGGYSENSTSYKDEYGNNFDNIQKGSFSVDSELILNSDFSNGLNYFEEEKDSINVLARNMVGYSSYCYGLTGAPKEMKSADGSTYSYCENGESIIKSNGKDTCAKKIKYYEAPFTKFFAFSFLKDKLTSNSPGVSFLGRLIKDDNYDYCMSQSDQYANGTMYTYDDKPKLSMDSYFNFLRDNIFFDNKPHLQYFFKDKVLEPAGVKCMTNAVCKDSLEAADKYGEYDEKIKEVRTKIIEGIISELKISGREIYWNNTNTDESFEKTGAYSSRNGYNFPIGSLETTEKNGYLLANDEPISYEVTSYFGVRTKNGEDEEHYGIDITVKEENAPIISIYSGEVVSIVNDCEAFDKTCNEGLGNTVIISHSNGDYSVYAHLREVMDYIEVGSKVFTGEVIGYLGSTGDTDIPKLHFEIRTGGDSVDNSVNPLSILDLNNPRPAVADGDFSLHNTSLTKDEFISKINAVCTSGNHYCSENFKKFFYSNPGFIYDTSIKNNVNPELVVVRAITEGYESGRNNFNLWGLNCANGKENQTCHKYSSLEEGIIAFANWGSIKNNEWASEMMKTYAFIGYYWWNPGGAGLGGCYYYPYIKEFMPEERSQQVAQACAPGNTCLQDHVTDSCLKTDWVSYATDETTGFDQRAYTMFQINKAMAPIRRTIFGL